LEKEDATSTLLKRAGAGEERVDFFRLLKGPSGREKKKQALLLGRTEPKEGLDAALLEGRKDRATREKGFDRLVQERTGPRETPFASTSTERQGPTFLRKRSSKERERTPPLGGNRHDGITAAVVVARLREDKKNERRWSLREGRCTGEIANASRKNQTPRKGPIKKKSVGPQGPLTRSEATRRWISPTGKRKKKACEGGKRGGDAEHWQERRKKPGKEA